MSVAIRSLGLSKVLVFTVLVVSVSGLGHAAPEKTESKINAQNKNIANPTAIMIPKPATINQNLIPQKNLLPLKKRAPAGLLPIYRPVVQRPVSPPPTDGLSPTEPGEGGSSPSSGSAPETVYEEPHYDQGYDAGGDSYGSPGGYYPDSSDGYYQQPDYAEPVPQPFRGVQGSLMDQQQFEFKPLAELSPSSPQAGNENDPQYEPGQVLVGTTSMDDARQLQGAIASAGYRPKSRNQLSQLGFVLTIFRLPADVSVVDAVAQLKEAFPGFLVSANTRYKPLSSASNKKNYAKSQINWSAENVQCASNLRIGLLDSEIDTTHKQIASSNIKATTVLPAGVSKKKSDHGTAIANLLVGGQQGLLPNAELFAVNVFRNTNGKPTTTTAWVIKAINSLLENKVTVINMGLGGARDEVLEYVVKTVFGKQVLMVAAAGNGGAKGKPVYPAAYPEVVAVTAVDASEAIFRKANRGDYIDIAAPGVDIWSISAEKGRYYTGTSFATPFVTAALSILRAQYPAESLAQIKSRLMRNAKDLGKKGKDPIYGQGLLNTGGFCRK